jgi:hypothetical protein
METERKEIDLELVRSLMDDKYYLIYVDYNDDLDGRPEVFRKCIEERSADHLHQFFNEWYDDQEYEAVREAMENIKSALEEKGYETERIETFFGEHEDEIREEIYSRGDSDGVDKLLRNTRDIPVRVELYSNHDCINSHWLESQGGFSYEESYFGDMVDALRLNPRKVKQILVAHGEKVCGRFPDRRSRNGKEYVSYEQFYGEMVNSTCGANLLTFMATVNPTVLYESGFNFSKLTIPKGNECGLFSSTYGGGSILEMKLLHDVTIDLERKDYPCYGFDFDAAGGGYSIKEVYGTDDSSFGKPIATIPVGNCDRISA